jgi:hypothetical protein
MEVTEFLEFLFALVPIHNMVFFIRPPASVADTFLVELGPGTLVGNDAIAAKHDFLWQQRQLLV